MEKRFRNKIIIIIIIMTDLYMTDDRSGLREVTNYKLHKIFF